MNAQIRPTPDDPGLRLTPQLRTVLLTDMADSTALVERLGDARAAALWQRLDLRTRDLLEFTGGRLIDKSDGLLALFERPVRAVDFALRYQLLLQELSLEEGVALKARVGIHVGELITWENPAAAVAAGAKPLEVEGLAKPVAARLMGLASPGQVLLSGMAQTLAQRAQGELGERASQLRWLVHGRYRFKGVPAPMLVHEVGVPGLSPLRAPPSGQKAWREVPVWRRPPVLAFEALVVLGLVGGSLYSVFKSPPVLAFHERDWVVVGDINNFTDDPRLEQSLDTALRVSLEQSQFVNLVPELKMQAALEQMGRSANSTVDRAVGSEIALREGARALLLPSVAEVGGRLRVNVEVVDPNTQVTVYAQTAEGRGAESALTSLDRINMELREKLGESLGDIQENNKPLAQVTTGNLDALRAYSLATDAYYKSHYADAAQLFEAALKLDPGFAMAKVGLAQMRAKQGQLADAERLTQAALSDSARMTERERLEADAFLARFGPTDKLLAKYRTWASIYPDAYHAYYGYSYISYGDGRYTEALRMLPPALTPRSDIYGNTFYLQGTILLSLNRYAEAEEAFNRGRALGVGGIQLQYAETYAAQRKYDEARRVLASQESTGFKSFDVRFDLDDPVIKMDQGQWEAANDDFRRLISDAATRWPNGIDGLRVGQLALRCYAGAIPGQPWRDIIDRLSLQVTRQDFQARETAIFPLLSAAWVAGRNGDEAAARRALEAAMPEVDRRGEAALNSLVVMVRAELALHRHETERAITLLRSTQDGHELFMTHALLLRAYLAKGDSDAAYKQANWLLQNRGRAYAEWQGGETWRVFNAANLAESNLAMLTRAELEAGRGNYAIADKGLRQFLKDWPTAATHPITVGRVAALRQKLDQLASSPDITKPKMR